MTDTQKRIAEWHATRPAFVGKVTREPMPGKQARKNAKARAITKANGS